jgi:carbon storage regulator
MLVLTRKLLEKLYIGDDICVTVVRVEGGQVRLGVDAPRSVPVLRGELRKRTQPHGERDGRLDAGPEETEAAPPTTGARESDTPHSEPSR